MYSTVSDINFKDIKSLNKEALKMFISFDYFLFIDNHFSSLYDPIGFINRCLTPGLCSLGILKILSNSSRLVSFFDFIYQLH